MYTKNNRKKTIFKDNEWETILIYSFDELVSFSTDTKWIKYLNDLDIDEESFLPGNFLVILNKQNNGNDSKILYDVINNIYVNKNNEIVNIVSNKN